MQLVVYRLDLRLTIRERFWQAHNHREGSRLILLDRLALTSLLNRGRAQLHLQTRHLDRS